MACQFQYLSGDQAGTIITLVQVSFWIGRDPRCEVSFDPDLDLQVSGRHAEIVWSGGAYQLNDSSTNGTFINGQAVKQVQLQHGDELVLGQDGPKVRFLLLEQEPKTPEIAGDPRAPSTSGPAAQQASPQLEQTANFVVPPLKATAGSAAPRGGNLRLILELLPTGETFNFAQPVVRIGRDPTADVALDPHQHLLVSYSHSKIMILEGQAVLFDTESTNGTFVNGQRVSRADLKSGEVIGLGQDGPRLRVTIEQEDGAGALARPPRGSTTVFGEIADFTGHGLGDAMLLSETPISDRMLIGRDPNSTIVLDSMYISNRHAVIERRGQEFHLQDTNSANGIFLDGQRIAEALLQPDTEFRIGPYLLRYTGASVQLLDAHTKTWIDAFELCRTDPKTQRNFLDRVSLKIQPGEFLCILGPSGCGKSTLLKSLNGSERASSGTVLMNNIDFYSHHEQIKHQVGYVPQDDIIHPQLSIWRTLHYAALLRLPRGTSAEQREERIRDVLSVLELYDHRLKPIHKLSGGQRKRVSIAVELLTDPSIIYLDEPTSGLDPNLEEKMMLLLREMTLRGKTVASVTHTLDNIHLADKITFLMDGKLAFFGSGDEAREFFDVERLPEVYKRFEEYKQDTDALRTRFEASPIYERNIKSQLSRPESTAQTIRSKAPSRSVGPGVLRQFMVLTSRYFEILTRDVRNTAILLLQAPLVALFICLAVNTDQSERGPTSTMFMVMSLSALWFGCSNAARELTKESAIYARERMVNLKILPYVASKFFVLQWLALVQVATMLLIVTLFRSGYTAADPPPGCVRWGIQACSVLILDGVPGSFWGHLLNLYLTALNGIGLGLVVSAVAGNSDKAMSLVPLILIPQVLFSGSFGIPKPDEPLKRTAGYVMSLNWSLDQAKRVAMCTAAQEKPPDDPGAGCTTCLHGYDPFKHLLLQKESQIDDRRCRAVLPMVSQMVDFPETLELMEDGLYTPRAVHGQGEARQATRSNHGFVVLGGYTLIFFGLVCVFLRRKDHLQP